MSVLQRRETLARAARHLRIEGGKTTDAPRRKLVKSLEKKKDQFAVTEVKSDRRSAFFDWLDTLRITLDLE